MAQYFYDFSLVSPAGNKWPHVVLPSADALADLIPGTYEGCYPVRSGFSMSPAARIYLRYEKYVGETSKGIPFAEGFSDFDLLLKIGNARKPVWGGDDCGGGIRFRASNVTSWSHFDGYSLSFGSLYHEDWMRTLRFDKFSAADGWLGSSQIIAATAFSARGDQWEVQDHLTIARLIRLTVSGTAIKARGWWEDEEEPAAWAIDTTDNGYASGLLAVNPGVYGIATDLYWCGVGTGSDAAPSAPLVSTAISGTVLDVNGDPCVRVVRAYHRATGLMLAETVSDALTGAYSFSLTTEGEIDRVVLDANGATLYNDLIDRVIPG